MTRWPTERPPKEWTTPFRSSAGRAPDLGDRYFRSRMERNYARYLNLLQDNGQIKGWRYEPTTFWFRGIQRGTVSYKPDFEVTMPDGSVEFHETKGWLDDKSRVKLRRMAKYHPTVKIVLIDTDTMRGIASWARLIPGWED